jgi:hypothetical protein
VTGGGAPLAKAGEVAVEPLRDLVKFADAALLLGELNERDDEEDRRGDEEREQDQDENDDDFIHRAAPPGRMILQEARRRPRRANEEALERPDLKGRDRGEKIRSRADDVI